MTEQAATSRRERNKLETRRRILAAASRLLAAHGMQATTADAIAEAADVSRATFFNYFPSKAAVVAALVSDLDDALPMTIDVERHTRATTAERLERVFVLTAKRFLSAPALYRVILGESERGYADVRQSSERFGRMQGVLRTLLAEGVAREEVRSDYSLELIAEMVGGVYVAVLHNWRVTKGYPLEARMQAAAHFLTQAIAPPAAARVARPAKPVRSVEK
jgi:AcrR family transcriptional regulator